MARLVKVQNREEMLQVKKKLRHLITFDRLLSIAQVLILVYISYALSV